MTSSNPSRLPDTAGRRAARATRTRWPHLRWLHAGTYRRALLHALLPTLLMMISATFALSAKAAPRPVDPYTDGAASAAAAEKRFDVYTDGASVNGPRDTFTDGARSESRPADANG
ncbi:hypothetical protein [Cupriavidus necator]|uniref:hypothetical protein n=1 Tax=Cupriavidus necator TaxID=106590 RepID=UPI000B32B986|nr:hypothetical protein [Cupriavidus necator]